MQAIHKLKESFVEIQANMVSYIRKHMEKQERYASHTEAVVLAKF